MRANSVEVDAGNVDRSAGFLTKTEREYLVGTWGPGDSEPGEWSEQQERSKRSDIKTRTRHAMADIALLQKHGDDQLIRNVIERQQSPDDNLSTYHEGTLENAKNGLSEFMIRLAYPSEEADEIVNHLHEIDLDGLLGEMSDGVGDAKQTAEQHNQALSPVVNTLQQYAEANDITRAEMLDVIRLHWQE